MRFVNLCVEVPEDLGKFETLELLQDNGHTILLFYSKGKVIKSLFPKDIFCVSGDLNFVINRTIKFYNFSNYDDFINSYMQREYLKDCVAERLKNGLQKENEKKLVEKKFSKRSRSKKGELGR